jgi:hypothetical protein
MADGTGTDGVTVWGWYPRSAPYPSAPTFEYLLQYPTPPRERTKNIHIIKCRACIYAVVATYDDAWKLHRHEREFARNEEHAAKAWCEVIARML